MGHPVNRIASRKWNRGRNGQWSTQASAAHCTHPLFRFLCANLFTHTALIWQKISQYKYDQNWGAIGCVIPLAVGTSSSNLGTILLCLHNLWSFMDLDIFFTTAPLPDRPAQAAPETLGALQEQEQQERPRLAAQPSE